MKNKIASIIILLILFSVFFSGCLDVLFNYGTTTYESHPTKINYKISYGYLIDCSGANDLENYQINYDCDLPEVLNGQIVATTIHDENYTEKTLATYNDVISWAIQDNLNKQYDLGITVFITSQSYVIADLNGADALSVQEIATQNPDLISQYCQAQSNETTAFIDPNNLDISQNASLIYIQAETDNAFILARELFRWLKQNTDYQTHTNADYVQPAGTTISCKTGDCDDLSYLYISLCKSLGIPARFIRGFLIDENTAIPHAWAEVFIGGGIGNSGWIPVECAGTSSNAETEIHQNFGVESADHLRLFIDDGTNESIIVSLSSLTYIIYGDVNIRTTSYADVSDYEVTQSNELVIDENNQRSYS